MSERNLQAEFERLKAENERLKAQQTSRVSLKVSQGVVRDPPRAHREKTSPSRVRKVGGDNPVDSRFHVGPHPTQPGAAESTIAKVVGEIPGGGRAVRAYPRVVTVSPASMTSVWPVTQRASSLAR